MTGSPTVGFIILRHVNSPLTNNYWIHSVKCVRKFYSSNQILIIDDNSNPTYITDEPFDNVTVIQSEYPGRGELLPYIYYLRNRFCDVAVIIHDSVFMNRYFDFTNVTSYQMLWEFEHYWDQIEDESRILSVFEDSALRTFHANKMLWKGCFGAMTVMSYDFLIKLNQKYDLTKLIGSITSRYNRCSFERVFACLLQTMASKTTLLGNIHHYCKWEVTFQEKDYWNHLPIIKCWTGR